eukprot:CAMPEP_0171155770 /NCGR_PEP_ID=MMETSP0790-20130122/1084_1 /TAXON_ID=2925 /ORGANISM="Alexandrium catenella, Strain OF101" /LENGTH=32 /DNA_ID= /DNA_START= /DNA_END= /DNA_ORIENTATION=
MASQGFRRWEQSSLAGGPHAKRSWSDWVGFGG